MFDGIPIRLALAAMFAPQCWPMTLDCSQQHHRQQTMSNGRLDQVQTGTYKTDGSHSGILYLKSPALLGLFPLITVFILQIHTLSRIHMPQGTITHAPILLKFHRSIMSSPLILPWTFPGRTLTATSENQGLLELIQRDVSSLPKRYAPWCPKGRTNPVNDRAYQTTPF